MRAPARFHNLAVAALGTLIGGLALGCGDNDPDNQCGKDGALGIVCPVVGTGELGFNNDGKPPEETDLFLPTRAHRGPDGLLYILDFNNWRIRRLDEDGVVRTIAGNGFHAPAFDGAPALDSPLDNPTDFVFMPDGRLVSVSFEDPRVLVYEDGLLYVIAGSENVAVEGNEGDGATPLQARFMELMGIAVGPDGALYLADSKANRVRVIRDDTVATVAGSGEPGYSGDGGAATSAALHYPTALAVDAAGNLYIADTLNHAVRRVDADGTIETVAGTGEPGLSGDGGPGVEAQLNEPNGLAVDAAGNLYIADRANFRLRVVGEDGVIDTLAGTDEGYAGDGEPGVEAKFGFLARLSMDGDRLLIADQSNGCIRSIRVGE